MKWGWPANPPPESIAGLSLEEARCVVSAWRQLATPQCSAKERRDRKIAGLAMDVVVPPWMRDQKQKRIQEIQKSPLRAAFSDPHWEWTVYQDGVKRLETDSLREVMKTITTEGVWRVVHRHARGEDQ